MARHRRPRRPLVGAWWPVREERLARLLDEGLITPEAAADFRRRGAIGSHVENLERNQGSAPSRL